MSDQARDADNIISRLAELQLSSTQRGQNIILEQHASSFKWLMASLLALNAGGLASLSNIRIDESIPIFVSAASFYLGIGLALLIAVFGQLSANASLPPLEKIAAFWVETSLEGEFDEAEFARLNKELQDTVKIALRSRIVGWLSFVAFSVGLATSVALKTEYIQATSAAAAQSELNDNQSTKLPAPYKREDGKALSPESAGQ